MKFSAREDINAPADHVWTEVCDFAGFERQAMRRGADVQRVDAGPVVEGSAWDVAFSFRGKDRQLRAEVTRLDGPNGLTLNTTSSGIDGVVTIELVPLTPQRTRFAMSVEMSAKTLPARLLLQSLKLAKANLTNRYKKRIGDFAEEIERRYVRAS